MKKNLFLFLLSGLTFLNTMAQNPDSANTKTSRSSVLETESWLEDATTIPFGKPKNRNCLRNSFNGIRLLFEPQFGHVFQTVNNRVEVNDFNKLLKFGFELNCYKGYASLQFLLIFPAAAQFDTLSEMRYNKHTLDPSGRINIDYGFAVGLSFFDGIIAVGYGGLFFDKRGFTNMSAIPKSTFNYQNNFIYFAIQPVSAIKSVVQHLKTSVR